MISDRLRGTAVRATTNIAPTQTLTDRPRDIRNAIARELRAKTEQLGYCDNLSRQTKRDSARTARDFAG
jgi:hypothetical protein